MVIVIVYVRLIVIHMKYHLASSSHFVTASRQITHTTSPSSPSHSYPSEKVKRLTHDIIHLLKPIFKPNKNKNKNIFNPTSLKEFSL